MKTISRFKVKVGEKVWYDVFPLVKHAPGVVTSKGIQSVGVWKSYLIKRGVSTIALWDELDNVTERRKTTSTIRMKDIKY